MNIQDIKNFFDSPIPRQDRSRFKYSAPEKSDWMCTVLDDNYIDILSELIARINPSSYLTIGVLVGSMESFLLQFHRPSNLKTIVACDLDISDYNPNRDNGSYAYRNICGTQYGNFQGEFVYIRADSQRTDKLAKLGPYDLVFVDGYHNDVGAEHDMVTAFNSLSPNGIILVHDLELEGALIKNGYNRWLASYGDKVEHIEIPATKFQLGLGIIRKL